jgi:predicted rRNA methylase YqxC with S4 and FtsJ domains
MSRRYHRRLVRLIDRLENESIREAVDVIVAGRVTVKGVVVMNPDALTATDAVVACLSERVLRGTVKLGAALTPFGVPAGDVCWRLP